MACGEIFAELLNELFGSVLSKYRANAPAIFNYYTLMTKQKDAHKAQLINDLADLRKQYE